MESLEKTIQNIAQKSGISTEEVLAAAITILKISSNDVNVIQNIAKESDSSTEEVLLAAVNILKIITDDIMVNIFAAQDKRKL